jgi:hypothetical protein
MLTARSSGSLLDFTLEINAIGPRRIGPPLVRQILTVFEYAKAAIPQGPKSWRLIDRT